MKKTPDNLKMPYNYCYECGFYHEDNKPTKQDIYEKNKDAIDDLLTIATTEGSLDTTEAYSMSPEEKVDWFNRHIEQDTDEYDPDEDENKFY